MSGWVAGAVVVSAGVSAYSQKKAGEAQADAAAAGMATEERIADRNIEFQKEMAEQQREDFKPWRDVGKQSLDKIWAGVESGEFEVGKVDVTQDPGYKFRLEQGLKAREKSAASRGRLLSGAQQKGIEGYAQDFGSQEYANAYARESNEKARRYNMLSGLSQGGQSSAAGQAQATSQMAGTTGNILSNLGRSQNMGEQQIGAARAGAYEGQATAVNQGIQNWLTYKAQ